MTMNRLSIRLAVATALCSAAGLATAADPAVTSGGKDLEEIVVTAQKRSERQLDVPVSVSVLSSQDLTQENMVSIYDYFSKIPDLQLNGRQTYYMSLRGLTTGGATNPTLGILIDDVPFGSTLQAGIGNSRFPDIDPSMLQNLEVLRGPQGTLYGASTIGGLIKYVTRQPDTEKFSARAEVGLASVDGGTTEWNERAYMNLPLWTDKAALEISGFNRNDPAYMDNVKPGFEGKDVNTNHTYGGSAALLLKPVDNLSITLTALRQKRDAQYSATTYVLPKAAGLPPTWVPEFGRDNLSLSSTSDIGDQQLYTGRIEWNVAGLQVTSITSYGKSSGTNFQDLSKIFYFIPFFYGYHPGNSAVVDIADAASTKKVTEELRIAGKAGPVDWRGGFFYTKEDGYVNQTLTLYDPTGALQAVPYVGKGPMTYKEYAGFADAVWHIASQWDLEGGVRYAKNDQTSGSSQVIDDPMVPVFGPTGTNPTYSSSDHSFLFEVSPSYHFSADLMAYARVASGYRPGGPNTVLPNVPVSYGPDKVINYEVGLKGLSVDRTVSFDLALFQINWSDIQLQNTDHYSQFTYTTNGGKAVSRGLEATVQYKPLDGLTIAASATFLDAKLSENLPTLATADTLVGKSGDQLPGSAKFSGNLSVRQDFTVTSWLNAYAGADLTYVGDRKSEFVNSGATTPDGGLPSRYNLPSYSTLDLRAGLATTSRWHLDAFVRNLTNEYGVVYATGRNGTNQVQANFLTPRTYGVSLAKDF